MHPSVRAQAEKQRQLERHMETMQGIGLCTSGGSLDKFKVTGGGSRTGREAAIHRQHCSFARRSSVLFFHLMESAPPRFSGIISLLLGSNHTYETPQSSILVSV